MNKILCSGAPRSGTSMFNLLMTYFKELNVYTNGTPSDLFNTVDVFTTQQRPDGKIWNDFIAPISFKEILEAGIKLIVIYRDGRDCLISKRKGHPDYWYGPELFHVEKWFNSINELLKVQEQVKGTDLEKNLFVVKYEELVLSPKNVMQEVEKFVGSKLDYSFTEFYKDYQDEYNMSIEGAIGSEYDSLRPLEQNSFNWKKEKHKDRMMEILDEYEDIFCEALIRAGYETDRKWIEDFR